MHALWTAYCMLYVIIIYVYTVTVFLHCLIALQWRIQGGTGGTFPPFQPPLPQWKPLYKIEILQWSSQSNTLIEQPPHIMLPS